MTKKKPMTRKLTLLPNSKEGKKN